MIRLGVGGFDKLLTLSEILERVRTLLPGIAESEVVLIAYLVDESPDFIRGALKKR